MLFTIPSVLVGDKAFYREISLKLQPLKLSEFTPSLGLPDLASRDTDAQLNWNFDKQRCLS